MNNENNFYDGSILNNALEEMRSRQNCCCPRYIPGPTGPTGPSGGPTGATARFNKSSKKIIHNFKRIPYKRKEKTSH